MEAQLKARQNAQALQDALRGLARWQEEQRIEDDALKRRKLQAQTANSTADGRADVACSRTAAGGYAADNGGRSSDGADVSMANGKPSVQQQRGSPDRHREQENSMQNGSGPSGPHRAPKKPSGHTYEHYREKWDRFDVDAALADSDDERENGDNAGKNGKSTGENGNLVGKRDSAPGSAAKEALVGRRAPLITTVGDSEATPAAATAGTNAADIAVHSGAAESEELMRPVSTKSIRNGARVPLGKAAVTVDVPKPRNAGKAQVHQLATAQPSGSDSKANEWKEKGNTHFRRGQFREALDCYSKSAELQPSCLAFANRAMAHLKLGDAVAAERDCSAAIQLDNGYVKAWQRRAAARKLLGKLPEAAADLEQAVRLRPTDKVIVAEFQDIVQQLTTMGTLTLPPATTIPIRTLKTSAETPKPPPVTPANPPSAKPEAPVPTAVAESTAAQQQGLAMAVNSTTADVSVPGVAKTNGTDVSAHHSGGAQQVSPAKQPSKAAADIVANALGPRPKGPPGASLGAPAGTPAIPKGIVRGPTPPKTGTEFEMRWKQLRGKEQQQADYLLLLQPAMLPTLFKTSLTADMLSGMLEVVASHVLPQHREQGIHLLRGLVKVPRFAMVSKLVPAATREGVYTTLKGLQGNGVEDLSALVVAFK